jgi:hypothetical protein
MRKKDRINTRIHYVCFEGGGDESHVEVNTFTEFFPLVAREQGQRRRHPTQATTMQNA